MVQGNILKNLFKNKKLPIYGKGMNSREWIYVDDHCDALFRVYEKGKIGENYNIGSNINLKNLDVVKNLLKVAKNKFLIRKNVKISFVKDRPGHDVRYAINSNKIKKQLNWKAKVNFSKGINLTFLWYLKNLNYYSGLKKKDIIDRLGINK